MSIMSDPFRVSIKECVCRLERRKWRHLEGCVEAVVLKLQDTEQ